MKVTLDLTKLLEEGRITPVEFDRLRMLGAQDTGSLGAALWTINRRSEAPSK